MALWGGAVHYVRGNPLPRCGSAFGSILTKVNSERPQGKFTFGDPFQGSGVEPLNPQHSTLAEREFFIDNLLVGIHFIIVMIRWTDIAPPFPGSLKFTLRRTASGRRVMSEVPL